MTRCFIGIMLPEEIRDSMVALQKRLQETGMQCKMVERENMHLSLSFLGDVEDLKSIIEKMKYSVTGMEKFPVDVKGLLLIPNEKFIRVIALDTHDKSGMLENMRLTVKKSVGGESYKVHATLCRVKTIQDKEKFMKRIVPLMSYDAGTFEAGSVQLIKSELSTEGPTYTIVEKFPLE